jgi:hypothetical protein
MYAILTLAVSMMLTTLMMGVASQHHDLATLYQSRTRWLQVQAMAESIQQYHAEKSVHPASIAALSATTGFHQTRSLTNAWQGYGLSPTINDGYWEFKRAVFISNDPSKGVDATTYLTNNRCGTGDYATAQSWCGAPTGKWFRSETREQYNEQISTQRVRIGRVMQKMATYYNNNQKFPNKNKSDVTLLDNSISTLAALAGFTGTAQTCGGATSSTYQFMGIPIDCADMFDLWGNAIGYQFINNKHIVVTSETPIYNNSGMRVIVAADFDTSNY